MPVARRGDRLYTLVYMLVASDSTIVQNLQRDIYPELYLEVNNNKVQFISRNSMTSVKKTCNRSLSTVMSSLQLSSAGSTSVR